MGMAFGPDSGGLCQTEKCDAFRHNVVAGMQPTGYLNHVSGSTA